MAKKETLGNYAVPGITGTSTTKPTTSPVAAATTTTTKTTSSSKKTSTSSSKGSSSSDSKAASATVANEPSYSNQFYSALSGGIPAADDSVQRLAALQAANAAGMIVNNARASVQATPVPTVSKVDVTAQKAQMAAREQLEKAQAIRAADMATAKGINALNENLSAGRAMYQTQRNQVDADENKALDNQVLYAEARGDRGGIGQSQYGSIQNAASTQRQAVNSAEVKLQTDTSRQIADLQAQGEFEKAKAVSDIGSKYLSELIELDKWATEKNVSIDEFNSKLAQWQNEHDLDVSKYLTDTEINAAKVAGAFPNGAVTAAQQNAVNDRYANSAKALINAGIVPSSSQLSAMGWTPEQYWVYKMAQQSAT